MEEHSLQSPVTGCAIVYITQFNAFMVLRTQALASPREPTKCEVLMCDVTETREADSSYDAAVCAILASHFARMSGKYESNI